MWVSRVLITAENMEWANIAAQAASGFATSVIMSPAEAGIEGEAKETLDGRPGVYVQFYQSTRRLLREQLLRRIGQCVMTCPTTAVFDALPEAKRKIRLGDRLQYFGDGFQVQDTLNGRKVWKIPVMEGEFIVEDRVGVKRGVAGGNFVIMAKSQGSALKAASLAVKAIKEKCTNVILPFPGGICRSGSKVGSEKYKLPASTNHFYCPTLTGKVETKIPSEVKSVYEIVINGLTVDDVAKAMAVGIKEAAKVEDVVLIESINFGGKLGKYLIYLKDIL